METYDDFEFDVEVAEGTTSPIEPPSLGLIPFEDHLYHRVRYASSSRLKQFARSPAHMKQADETPDDPTPAKFLGTAIHTALLEPDKFYERYAMSPKFDKRTKAGKEGAMQWELENIGKYPLVAPVYASILRLTGIAESHPIAGRLLKAPGFFEHAGFWKHPKHGVLCKIRPDKYIPSFEDFEGNPVVLDIKTTEDATPEKFARDVATYGYHIQAAMYLDGMSEIMQKDHTSFVILAIEKEMPHGILLYELDAEAIQRGRDIYNSLLPAYAECEKTGEYPCYPPEMQFLSLPNWA